MKSLLRAIFILLLCLFVRYADQLSAQTASQGFTLRVVSGRNGRPIANEIVKLWYDEQQGNPILVKTDAHGTAQVPPPVVPALRVILYPTEEIDCRVKQQDVLTLAYSLKMIHAEGVAVSNDCGAASVARKKPGELVLYVRDRRWYDSGVNQ